MHATMHGCAAKTAEHAAHAEPAAAAARAPPAPRPAGPPLMAATRCSTSPRQAPRRALSPRQSASWNERGVARTMSTRPAAWSIRPSMSPRSIAITTQRSASSGATCGQAGESGTRGTRHQRGCVGHAHEASALRLAAAQSDRSVGREGGGGAPWRHLCCCYQRGGVAMSPPRRNSSRHKRGIARYLIDIHPPRPGPSPHLRSVHSHRSESPEKVQARGSSTAHVNGLGNVLQGERAGSGRSRCQRKNAHHRHGVLGRHADAGQSVGIRRLERSKVGHRSLSENDEEAAQGRGTGRGRPGQGLDLRGDGGGGDQRSVGVWSSKWLWGQSRSSCSQGASSGRSGMEGGRARNVQRGPLRED